MSRSRSKIVFKLALIALGLFFTARYMYTAINNPTLTRTELHLKTFGL